MDEAEVTSMSRSTDTAAGKITAFFGDVFSFRDNKKLEKAMTTGAEKTEACKTKTEIGRPGKTGQWNGAVSDWSKFEGVFFQDFSGPHGRELCSHFLSSVAELLTIYVQSESDRSTKVLDFHHPHQLKEMMSHCLDIHSEGRDVEQLLSDCKETLKYCVKTGHPHFLNQLSTGVDVVGVAGTWLAASVNTNMFTYEAAPVFTLMEEVVLARMRKLIGWDDGEAMFAPGGAISNLYSVLLARHRSFPEVKTKGLSGSRLVVMTSEQSHFSITRAAAILGLGTDNVVYVRCHSNGKMDITDLRQQIAAVRSGGGNVIMVNATCGTTVLGAFDPVSEMADICEEFGIWLHCDCAWGGGALLSSDHRHLLAGIHRVDSVTWNPHKMMGVPLQCSAFLTRHKGLLKSCNSLNAAYLYQKDKHYDVTFDTGDLSIQCGRHNDIFKLWLMWRSKGDHGFEDQINKNFQLAVYLRDKVKERPGFHLVLEEIEGPNVCFWYLPPAWRSRPLQQVKDQHLQKVAPILKAKMMEAGSLMVQYQPLGKLPNLFRVAVSNPALNRKDLDFLLEEMDNLGHDIPTPADWLGSGPHARLTVLSYTQVRLCSQCSVDGNLVYQGSASKALLTVIWSTQIRFSSQGSVDGYLVHLEPQITGVSKRKALRGWTCFLGSKYPGLYGGQDKPFETGNTFNIVFRAEDGVLVETWRDLEFQLVTIPTIIRSSTARSAFRKLFPSSGHIERSWQAGPRDGSSALSQKCLRQTAMMVAL
ncbi:hypothetical protein RRG08_012818 [Elysia crispata]|uniref:Glutamate decarboxylase n=1 Tax=Elysia crispata TaxID=231223 RepID=A0AAE1CP89_9GAST|nr:hypothetical protein RRG08_012818 [Elysia crispata]